MQAHAPAATRKPAGYFHRNGVLSQLMSVLLAWTMVMSSLPVYATDQPRAEWVHSSGFDGASMTTWPQKTSSTPGETSHKLAATRLSGPKQRKELVGAGRIQLASLKTPAGLGGTHALLQSTVTGESSIASNFNGTAIPGGSFIWLSSVFKASGLGSQPVRVFLRGASLQFTAAGATYNLPVPDATITFSPTATSATTSFDSGKNAWITNLPSAGLAGNSFLSGMTFPVPANGLPGGINPVTWSGTFYSDTSGVSINWQWAAAVYTSFGGDYRTLNVKPVDDTSASVYKNSDHAGTPEAYKTFVTGGARGGGGSNYTGSYSATASVLPLNEVPNYPPVANAGPAQTVFVGTTVQLDGSGSTDQDGNPLTYRWSFVSIPSGSRVTLNGANTVKPTFVPDVPGSYTVQLIVNDGLVDSSPAIVTISTKNSPPVANAGPDQTITTGALVQLDGSRSTDVDGDALTYSWSLVNVPVGSTATLSNRTIVNPTFVADKKGTYTVQLVVNDGTFDSAPSQVSISDVNSPPVANAGPAQTVVSHTLVTLDGSHSTDVDGDSLTYTWSILSAPAGSAAVLSDVHAVKPTFTVDLLGDYVIQLIVNDGTLNSQPSTVTVTTENSPPVANAGPAQTVPLGSVVTLDGTGSSDVDGQALTYAWSILSTPANSTAILSLPTSATPSFIADKAGNYVIQLIVNDGIVNSQPATVMISTINSIPVANPGAAQSVESGSLVALDGSGSSDADGDPLTFTWAILSQPAGGTAILSDAHNVSPTFVANVAGFYVVQLIVNDGKVDSPPMTVTITVESPLLKLSAPAGVSALPGQSVSLEFTVSNPGNVPAQGATVTEGATAVSLGTVAPGQSLPAPFSISAPAVAPKGAAETDAGYLSRLQSSENQITSVQANLSWNDLGNAVFGPVSASTSVTEQFPIIVIGLAAPATANSGDAITYTVTLTNIGHAAAAQASGTIVLPNGTQQPLTATAILAGASVQSTFTFSTPRTQSSGPITATASIAWQDGNANNYGPLSASATTALIQPNQPPVVNAGQNQIVPFPNLYPLQGTVTDDGLPNGTLISTWTQISGPAQATFTDPHSPTTTVLLNAVGTYVFRLTGDDSQLQASADVAITTTTGNLPPVVKVGPDQIITLPVNTVTVTGNATDDGLPVGSTLQVQWTRVSGPGTVTFGNAASPSTTASFSQAGTYLLRLSASDSQLTGSAEMRVTVLSTNNITLSPAVAGPLVKGTSVTLTATVLINSAPASGVSVAFTVNGANTAAGTGVTDSSGKALFSYTGTINGTDIVVASASLGGSNVNSNTASISWVTPAPPISTTSVLGRFFSSDGSGAFDTPSTATPAFSQTFPNIDFNPPAGTVSGNTSAVNTATRPFTDITTDINSNFAGAIPAQGNNLQAGVGSLFGFQAVFTGTYTVAAAGDVTFNFFNSDGFIFGVGNNASRVSGTLFQPPASGLTPFENYPVMGAFNASTIPIANQVKVHFPAPGTYPYEVDYAAANVAAVPNQVVVPPGSTWKYKLGSIPGFEQPSFDDSAFSTGQSPFTETLGPDGCSLVGKTLFPVFSTLNLRKTLNLPGGLKNATAFVAIDNDFTLWINGTQVTVQSSEGCAFEWNRTVPIPNNLWHDGVNVIAVQARDRGGLTGFEFQLTADVPKQISLVMESGNGAAIPPSGSVTLLPDTTITENIGQDASFTTLVKDASGSTVANAPVTFNVAGPNIRQLQSTTDGTGHAAFRYRAFNPGVDLIQVQAQVSGMTAVSNQTLVNWTSVPNQPPVVNAGADQSFNLPANSTFVNGTVTDDGLPNGSLSVTWSQVSGPAPVSFGTPNSLFTEVTFSTIGTYTLQLTATDSQLSGSATVHITVNPPVNQPPVVNAGPNQTITTLSTVLQGSVSDDGLPTGSALTSLWTVVQPAPGTVTFADPTSPGTQVTFSAFGNYILQLTASDSQLSSNAFVAITVNPPANQPPVVNAGADQTIGLPGIAVLNGIVTDDGLPNHTLITVWKLISGPGAVIFTDPAAAITKATFSATGTYVLQLSANDTQFISTANVTVTVADPEIPNGNLPPAVSAGADQNIVLPQNSVTLNGTVTDDGFPSGGALSQFWSMVTGPGKVTFANPNAAVTTATFNAVGTYVLRLIASDSELSASSDVTIKVSSTATPGGVFITGHDPDGHAWRGDNTTGAQHILQRSVSYVTFGRNNPRILLATSLIPVPSDADSRPGMIASGFNVFDVADDGTAGAPTLDLHTVDFSKYDVIITGSGILQSELDLLNLRASELANFVNTGGGIVALSEGGGHGNTSHDRFAFLPFNISPVPFNQDEFLFELTLDGEALGLSAFDVNFNASHDIFQSSGGLKIIDTDSAGNIISLAQRGLLVGLASINNPPKVSAGPDQVLQFPTNTLLLNGSATDDGLPTSSTLSVQWTQLSGPAPVSFTTTSQPQTQVAFTTPGAYVLRLTASDSQLFTVADVRVTVRAANGNQAPRVSAGPDQTINSASTFLNGAVSDDGLPVGGALTSTWSVASGPGSVTFINPSSPVTQVVFGAAGTYFLALTASDSELTSSAVIKIVVTAAVNLAPVVNAGADQTITLPVNTVTLNGSATDDGLPVGIALRFAWNKISGPAGVTFSNPTAPVTEATFTVAGTYVLQLAVTDTQLTGTATAKIIVNQIPPPPPVVSFTGLADGAEITKPTPIIGSVSSGSWKLEYSLLDGAGNPTTFVQFASGTTAVNNGTLGTFDPTVLLNGQYLVRFTTIDAAAQTATATATVDVSRNTKVGNFTLSFNDLSVPLPGLPITVTRTYDSRDKRVGDFGVGWTLSLANVRVQKTGGAIGKNWDEEVQWSGFFPTYCLQPVKNHVVSVTFPDGKVYKFQAASTPQCQQFVPIDVPQIGFTQIPTGSATAGASLTPIGDTDLFLDAGIPGPVNLITAEIEFADYTQFQMKTAEGFTYILDQTAGATSVTDPNGNTLTINTTGVISSTGTSVVFTRDTLGRITQIMDPAGKALHYAYSATGDLGSFTDRASNTTTYTYDTGHLLLDIIDPQGVEVAKNTYDAQGRLTSTTDASGNPVTMAMDVSANREIMTDRAGNPTVYEYDDDGNVIRTTDALGNISSATFDPNDNKLKETNALGKTSSYTYDAAGNRLSETDPLGHVTRYTYNNRHQVLSITDPQGHVTSNTYDANGNLLSGRDALGNLTSLTNNAQGMPLTIKDALGNTTSYAYDVQGHVILQTDGAGNISSYTNDANGNRLTQTVTRTRADGITETLTTQYQYDGNNRLVKTINSDGSFTRTVYNANGKVSDSFDAQNRKTHFDYDNNGRLIKTTYPDSATESVSYDPNDRVVASVDRLNRTTSFTYDALGRLTRTTYPDNTSTQTVYDAIGQTIQTIDALNHATSFTYDDAGRRTSITDALNNVTTFSYDAAGNRTSVTDALNHTTQFIYDSTNRRIRTISPDQTSESTAFDAMGRLSARTDAAGKITQYGYDAIGRLSSVTQFLNNQPLVTSYAYDELGDRISQTDANGHTTRFAYDSLGHRTSRTLPLGINETYTYDAAGNMTSKTDFNGRTTSYQYDTMNRLTVKTADTFFSTGACAGGRCGAPQITYNYNAIGRRVSMLDASGATSYTYDARDHLLTKATAAAGTLIYTYDAAGNMLTLSSSNVGGASMTYTYDALNRLGSATDGSGSTSYAYDAVGNLSGFTYPNGVKTTYSYNTLNRLTQMQSTCGTGASGCGTSGTAISRYTYTLGAAGNRLSVAELGGRTVNYAYDDIYRLTSETISSSSSQNGAISYQYDSVGNRLQRNSSVPAVPATGLLNYDANDRISTDPYDANGNLLNAGAGSNVYDFENRLVQAGGVQLVYDGDGNRVSETVAGVTTKYLVADQNLTGFAQIVDELQDDALTRTYSYGLELIKEQQTIAGTPATSFYGYDGHGSVRFLTDSTGAVTDTYNYDAFGNLLSQTGATPNNYLFAGQQFDPVLGVYYNRARYYDQRQGRFWTMDTYEGNPQSPNSLHKYLFTGSDPVNHADPSGNDFDLGSLSVGMAVGATIAAIAVITIGLWIRGNLTQGDAEQPPSANATSTNENSIEIYNSRLSADQVFSGFVSSFQGVNDGDVASVSGGPVSGVGQKLTFELRARSALGLLSLFGQSPFSVRSKRYDSTHHAIAVVTLQGHPLRGYRYWQVFSPDNQPGHLVIDTGALDEPGPGPLDGLKFILGRSQQMGLWREYMEDALRITGGREGFGPEYDFPFGLYGIPSRSEVYEQVTGIHP
jgi:RHS repeat-associated protein/uncharacterized repeat protein (TIGR01451 family)